MALTRLTRLALLVLVLVATGDLRAQYDVTGAPRAGAPLTILQINDVYSTVPVDGRGGLARVATVKQRVAAAGGRPLLLLAGDFLSSSVSSTVFQGEQMIATLNAAGLDMATLGNHEFDFGIDVLLRRMAEARWTWVVSNVIDRRTGSPLGGAAPYVVREFGGLTVGILGLCIADDSMTTETLSRVQVLDPVETAARYLPAMQAAGAEFIILLTHLAYATDRQLADRFPAIDVIVGGHEHFPITAIVGSTLISKAGTDGQFIARIDVTPQPGGAMDRHFELMPVTSAIPEDAATAAVANSYESRLDGALETAVGVIGTPLDGVGPRLRTSETNLGNLVADAIRQSVGTEIALVNGGGIRGERVFPVGPFLRRTVVEIHPFGNVVCRLEVPGRVVLEALEHGASALPTPAGAFLQVSGLSLRIDPSRPPGARVRDVRVNGVPLDPARTYTLALPSFLLLGGDGYDMFQGQRVVISPESGPTMASALERYVTGRTVTPGLEDRIVTK